MTTVTTMRSGILLALAVVVLASAEMAEPAATSVVDRTFACTPLLAGGARVLDLWASPPRTDPWTIPAYLVARTGTTLPSEDLVYVRARTQGKIGWTRPFSGPGGVYAHSRRCSPARASVALSSKGLPGTPTGWYSPVSCTLRGRVLVRVRALLSAPAGWGRTGPLFQGARKDVLEASLAIRSERTGEPLAFMTLNRAGETRLWSSSRCR